jgi:hypothetical protein
MANTRGLQGRCRGDDNNAGTALHCAVKERYMVVMRLLLEHKANAKTNSGCTVLYMAAAKGFEVMVGLLLEDSQDRCRGEDLTVA